MPPLDGSLEELLALARAQIRLLRVQLADRDQELSDVRHEHDLAKAKLTVLEHRIEQMRKRLYGATSERHHHPGQERLDLGVAENISIDEVSASVIAGDAPCTPTSARSDPNANVTPLAAASTAPSGADAATSTREKPSRAGCHPGRRALPIGAEVVIQDVTIPEDERRDADGVPLPLLGYRTTDQWDYRVGTYLIRRIRRAIYGRPFSEALDRITAAAPVCLIPRGKMTDAALIHTVIDKFSDHLPLYRQQQRAARTGFHLSRATLVSHVTVVAAALRPLYDVIAERVRQARFVHLDDTPVKLLDPGRGRAATARIWVYRSEHETAFQFTATREGLHPAGFLKDYRGFIVADAYAGHEQLYGPAKATAIGCWAHVRRKFYDIHTRDPFAARVVDDIGHLYAIEDDLRLVDDDQRRRVRQARSGPLLIQLRQHLDQARITALPASDLGRAIAYAVKRWPTLTPYLDHGFLPIDNNPAENALRPWAIGRKNWLFLGSHAGGERAAIICTLIANCRMQGIDPYAYLIDTVAQLHRGHTDYDTLTPLAYAQTADRAIG